MIKIIIAFMTGGAFGVMIMSCLIVAGRADRLDEEQFEPFEQFNNMKRRNKATDKATDTEAGNGTSK